MPTTTVMPNTYKAFCELTQSGELDIVPQLDCNQYRFKDQDKAGGFLQFVQQFHGIKDITKARVHEWKGASHPYTVRLMDYQVQSIEQLALQASQKTSKASVVTPSSQASGGGAAATQGSGGGAAATASSSMASLPDQASLQAFMDDLIKRSKKAPEDVYFIRQMDLITSKKYAT